MSTEAGATEQQELVDVSNEVDFFGFFSAVVEAMAAWKAAHDQAEAVR